MIWALSQMTLGVVSWRRRLRNGSNIGHNSGAAHILPATNNPVFSPMTFGNVETMRDHDRGGVPSETTGSKGSRPVTVYSRPDEVIGTANAYVDDDGNYVVSA